MPGDVIDLVSSSPPPQSPKPVANKEHGQNNTIRSLAGAAAAARALSSATKPVEKDDWFTISSDGLGPDTYSLPKRSLEPPNTSASSFTKVTKVSTSSKPAESISKNSGANDFFLLSDDFDSTVNFDDSFAQQEPAPKRRRVSSSPALLPPKERPYQRSISNIEPSKTKPPPVPKPNKAKVTKNVVDLDPIVFTSSPDPYENITKKRKDKAKDRSDRFWEISSDNEESVSQTKPVTGKTTAIFKSTVNDDGFLSLTDDEEGFPELHDFSSLPKRSTTYQSSAALRKYNDAREAEKTGKKVVKPISRTGSGAEKAKVNTKTAEEKALEKAKSAEEKARDKAKATQLKEAAKEEEKERKRLARKEADRQKEFAKELAKVNTAKTDKKVSTPEMIIEVASAIDPIIKAQVEKMASSLQVDFKEWNSSKPIVKWKRKVTSQYNEELGHWEPVPLVIKPENHILYVMEMKVLVELALGNEENNLDHHVLQLKSQHPNAKLIYLIEGMLPWSRKNKGNKNKQFAAAVNSHLAPPTGTQRKKKIPDYVDEEIIEEALLQLQIVHEALIHHTAARIETAEWIMAFTQHISTIPYRAEKEALDTAFCMESGQVKTGVDAEDTFVKMLQEILRLTSSCAYGIAGKYPDVPALIRGFEQHGPGMLEDLRKVANRNGAVTDKRIGPSISRRVYSIFMGRDPGSTDV
ncbi:hypothetical protein GLAREA_10882 [Glarea lozoyensis ATCC 20868]|uniref:ERCC4 domain-containing protein n=2 Tax=Glarea lozoyensis TaxID=101852 RepID=S3DTA8_GLAL2|nr:uncharacterized protein GLAREA_10882 [Glarea lozoyensis ATCC 20868]EPE35186.1 hypothetical protein GLAREA_10882 [Glarea lozoyensis ATCC 20868]